MHDGWSQACSVAAPPLTKFRASQIFIEESCLRALLSPACLAAADRYPGRGWKRPYFSFYACHSDTKPAVAADKLSVWAGDWQPGELVAAGHSRSVALSPSANYTSHITGRGDGTDGGAQTDSLSKTFGDRNHKYRMTVGAEYDALIPQCDEPSYCRPSHISGRKLKTFHLTFQTNFIISWHLL